MKKKKVVKTLWIILSSLVVLSMVIMSMAAGLLL